MKYIPADKLIAEIERLMSENCKLGKKAECFIHRAVEDNAILALVESLQQEQPEVDLKMVVRIDNIVMNLLGEGYNSGYKTRPFYEEVLRRLNARKEDTK